MISLNKEEQIEICKKYIENGVKIIDITSTYIENNVKIGEGTIIYPNNIIEGNTQIGKNVVLGPNNRIKDSVIEDLVDIQYSVVIESKIGSETRVGPYAYLRPNSDISSKVKIGDFVEIKNSIIGEGTSVAHLTYIGDSDVGKSVNFGCGTAIANYNGKEKFRTQIGDKCFIGCNTNLVAPVKLGEGVYTGAGTTVTKDSPDYSLVIGRAEEKIVPNWAKGKYK